MLKKESAQRNKKESQKTEDSLSGMDRVYICAPYDGEFTRSREKLWWYCIMAKEHGYIPVAPYLYYPSFMHMNIEKDRKLVSRFAREDMCRCKELWFFGTRLTDEMASELEWATKLGLPFHCYPDWDDLENKDCVEE